MEFIEDVIMEFEEFYGKIILMCFEDVLKNFDYEWKMYREIVVYFNVKK